MKKQANPQAFPVAFDGSPLQEGMTLRDYFAAKALVGMLANPTTKPHTSDELFAQVAYNMADAMLAQREKP